MTTATALLDRDVSSRLVELLRRHEGGMGTSLSVEQKKKITEGSINEAENKTPFRMEKFEESADIFFVSHSLSSMER